MHEIEKMKNKNIDIINWHFFKFGTFLKNDKKKKKKRNYKWNFFK
jgi:hypothetical protein